MIFFISRRGNPSPLDNQMESGCPYGLTAPLPRDSIPFMAKARYHYNIMLRPEPEGGYTALVPALPGCVTYGRTLDEAREMAKDAISGYIASLRKHKDPIPTDDNTLVASLDLEYAEVTRR
jgi:antitoxin HicB